MSNKKNPGIKSGDSGEEFRTSKTIDPVATLKPLYKLIDSFLLS